MKKLFSIFTALMLVILPLCFTGCGNNNVVKDWTEVQAFGPPSSNSYSRIYFSYTEEECTEEEYNNAQNKLNSSDLYYWQFDNNKKTSIEKAQERLNHRIYYCYISYRDHSYYKITCNGFYTDIIQIKIYSNNYIEYKHVYEDYGTVDIEHHSHVEGTLNDTYRITYFE